MNKTITASVVGVLFALVASTAIAEPARPAVRSLCQSSRYTCIIVQRGETWNVLFPDIDQRDLVMRVNRMNIRLHPGMVIAVPTNLVNTRTMDLAPLYQKIDAPGRKTIIVDLPKFAWGAYDSSGNLVNWGPVSGGRGYCPDIHGRCRTPVGKFAIYAKGGGNCKSTKFPVGKGGAPMPFCMFFHGGYALHGSPEVPGYHASHGCVRMFYPDARWLNQEFIDLPNSSNGYKGTQVIVRPYGV